MLLALTHGDVAFDPWEESSALGLVAEEVRLCAGHAAAHAWRQACA